MVVFTVVLPFGVKFRKPIERTMLVSDCQKHKALTNISESENEGQSCL